jgi:hypothetical protein
LHRSDDEVTDMNALLDQLVERTPMQDHDGKSGALLEQARLADGTRVVIKWLDRSADLVMQATGDEAGREYVLWRDGVFDRLPVGIGHAVLEAEPAPGGAALVMRDVSESIIGWSRQLNRAECRQVLGAAARLHGAFADETATPGACPLVTWISILTPNTVRSIAGGPNPLPDLVLRGWDVFASLAPADVAEVVLAVLDNPELLARPLAARPMTVIHGDLSLANIAVEQHQMTLLDWGLAAIAPPAVELASFLIDHISQVDASHEQIIADFQEESGDRADPVALRLALLAGLVELGWHKALNASTHTDPAFRASERKDLEWWYQRAREAAPML